MSEGVKLSFFFLTCNLNKLCIMKLVDVFIFSALNQIPTTLNHHIKVETRCIQTYVKSHILRTLTSHLKPSPSGCGLRI